MKKVINVDGMTCDHCVNTIKQALENQVGILNVEVKIEKSQVIIEINKTTVKLKDVEDKITEVGFQVRT